MVYRFKKWMATKCTVVFLLGAIVGFKIKAKKGKSNPLIDTGELRKSITYVVSNKK